MQSLYSNQNSITATFKHFHMAEGSFFLIFPYTVVVIVIVIVLIIMITSTIKHLLCAKHMSV